MIRKLEAAEEYLHLLITLVHAGQDLCDPQIHIGKPHFHRRQARFKIANASSDFTYVSFQIRNIRLNSPKDELVTQFGHSLHYR
jgi:hypothetical protein